MGYQPLQVVWYILAGPCLASVLAVWIMFYYEESPGRCARTGLDAPIQRESWALTELRSGPETTMTAGDLGRRMKAEGIGDAALARVLGVTPVAVWYWRRGRRPISQPMALLLAAYFDGKLDLKPCPLDAGRREGDEKGT